MEIESGTSPSAEAGAGGAGEVNVDQILADVDAGREVGQAPQEAQAEEPQQPVWNGQEWEFEWNGKKIVPDSADKLKIWASQGYNYSQRMGDLNKTHAQRMAEAEARERQAHEVESRFKPYAEIDDFAKQNKDWWDHVQKSYQERATHGVDPAIAQVLAPIQEKLSAFDNFLQQQEQAKVEAEYTKQDQALDAEIESIRKSHPNIDLSARDETGETLERRVMLHARELGTSSFRAAFRDYFHDQLVTQGQAEKKVQAVRGAQAEAKAGLLGRTQAPTKELKTVDTKRPWNDPQYDVETILQELRQIGG